MGSSPPNPTAFCCGGNYGINSGLFLFFFLFYFFVPVVNVTLEIVARGLTLCGVNVNALSHRHFKAVRAKLKQRHSSFETSNLHYTPHSPLIRLDYKETTHYGFSITQEDVSTAAMHKPLLPVVGDGRGGRSHILGLAVGVAQ